MNLQDYLEFVHQCIHTGVTPNDLPLYAELGWQGEMGEVRQLLSKALRQVDRNSPLSDTHWAKLLDGVGDVLFYQCAYYLHEPGADLEGVEWRGMPWVVTLDRNDSIETLSWKLSEFDIADAPVFCPQGMTLAELAFANWQKLTMRMQETGSYAKAV